MKNLKKFLVGLLTALPLAVLAQTFQVNNLNAVGTTTTNNLTATGTVILPSASVTLANLATQAANTVLANVTASAASPTAFTMPSCSTSASALNYTTSTGFTCNTAVNAAQLGGATFASPGPIGSTTASTGAFTTLSASSTVSGTGFSTYLASPPAIGATTPSSGKFTTLQATGAITPSTTAGIVGTTAADNANAGSVGEFPSPTNLSGVSLTNSTGANVSSVSLTAGDWDVQCVIQYVPASTTVIGSAIAGVSTVSAGLGSLGSYTTYQNYASSASGGNGVILSSPVVRINISTTTTTYCVAFSGFSTSTQTASGFLRARRIR